MSKGFGDATWWGFSPALDLLQSENIECPISPEADPASSDGVKLLLVGAADLRHVLKTLAESKRHTSKPLHFYVIENSIETVARHMLFLSIIMEPLETLGLQEKAELFMELYGNILVRPQSDHYLKRKAPELIKMITDEDHLRSCLPPLDTRMLKFKDRDALETIFKRWRGPPPENTAPSIKTHLQSHWDSRLRQYLGTRYDTRRGVFDWDYHMKLSEMAPPLSCREYVHWREVGVAFQLRSDASYDVLNSTLLSYRPIRHGLHEVPLCAYWGDIVTSPYLSFGIDSDNKQLVKDHSGDEMKKSSQLVAEYNVLALFHELFTGDPYKSTPPNGCLPVVVEEKEEKEERREEEEEKMEEMREGKEEGGKQADECRGEELLHTVKPQGPLFNGACQIFFMSPSLIHDMARKVQFKNLFNVVYLSNSMVHTLKDGIEAVFAPNCTVFTETAKYILDLTKDQKAQFVARSTELATNAGLKPSTTIDSSLGSTHLHFLAVQK